MKDFFSFLGPGELGVKICGITNAGDAAMSIAAGATALGFNFFPGSKRYLELKKERAWLETVPGTVLRVGVVVNPSRDEAEELLRLPFLDALQFHGDETYAEVDAARQKIGKPVIKAIRVRDEISLREADLFPDVPILLDAFAGAERGGTGHSFDWNLVAKMHFLGRTILSGGLKPENVDAALRLTKVRYIDVASGVEEDPRKKNRRKVMELIAKTRQKRD